MLESNQEASSKRRRAWRFQNFAMPSKVWNYIDVSNSNYASIIAKDVICDAMPDRFKGLQPKPLVEGGASVDVPWAFSLYHDFTIFYRDMNCVSLHKRGHKDLMHYASLNEGIVIAILTIAGWNQAIIRFKEANQNSSFTTKGGLFFGSHVWVMYIFY